MNFGSVRVRLTLWNIGVLVFFLITFAVAVGELVRESVYESVDEELYNRVEDKVLGWPSHRPGSHSPRGAFGPGSQDHPPGPPPDHWGEPPGQYTHPVIGQQERDGTQRPAGRSAAVHPLMPRTSLQSELPPKSSSGGPDLRGPWMDPPPPPFEHHTLFHMGPPPENRVNLPERFAGLDGRSLFGGDQNALWDAASFHQSLKGERVYATITHAGQELRVLSVPLMHHGVIEGVLQVAYPLGDLARVLDVLKQVLLALLPLEILIAGLGALFLTGRALRPVRHIREVAQEISAHDLSRRIEVTGSDEISELAVTLNDMVARLQNSFEQQRRFVADASHELRTPLATIKTSTTLALSQERDREAYREALHVADRATDRMHRLVEDLLLLARSDASQIDLERQPIPIGEILQYATEMVNTSGKAPLHLVMPDRNLIILADVEYLVRVFVNFLTNALRHTPPSGEIRLSAYLEGDTVVAEVADNGEGIPEEHLPHLGQRFYRIDRSRTRAQGGTGLGLAISKSIVEAHHGSLEFRSRLGQGATAIVRLPLHDS